MLSLILYGRNDSHGYNLHKRVAISLNCLSEVLTGDGDEILFVDCNTPNQWPTLPEAIADTLTEATRDRLRVLRLRPAQVEPWRRRTHLPVMEPVARNVALRRARPENRWVLSTNTDMVILPPQGGRADLSALVAGLEPGIYHLPRYELPEGLWEGLDRRDPDGIFRFLGEWGAPLHLPELVAGSPPALYDNHGDFQLLPRSWLEAVHGFDERMLNGWIVDSNLSVRLALRHGPARSLYPHLVGYHCDHTRNPGAFHGREHVENDFRRFVAEVDDPQPAGQAGDWGMPGADIEEIRLAAPGTPPLLSRLRAILPPPPSEPPRAAYAPEIFDTAHYPAEHVLPYLCDLLAPLARGTRIGWTGARRHMRALLAKALELLGFPPLTDGLDADVVIFEFGAASQDDGAATDTWTAADLEILAGVRKALFLFADGERASVAAGAPPRLAIVVNAVHNRFEAAVHDCLAVSRDPYSPRLRHGVVLDARPPQPPRWLPKELAPWLAARTGRAQVPVTEAVRLITYAEELLRGEPPPAHLEAMARAAGTLLAVLDHPGLPPGDHAAARRRLEEIRPGRGLSAAASSPHPGPAEVPSRAACFEDWDDAAWLALARRHFTGAFAANVFRRDAATWTRVQVLHQLSRLGPCAVVIASDRPDPLWDVLSELEYSVTIIDLSPEGNLSTLPPGGARRTSRLRFVTAPPTDMRFQAALRLAPIELPWLADLVAEGGMLAESALVDAAAPLPPPPAPGFTPLPQTVAVTAASLDAFTLRTQDRVLIPSLWFCRRDTPSPRHA